MKNENSKISKKWILGLGIGGAALIGGGIGGYALLSNGSGGDTEEPSTSIVAEVETENTEEAMKELIEDMISSSTHESESTEAVTEKTTETEEKSIGGEEVTSEADPGGAGSPKAALPNKQNGNVGSQNSTGNSGKSTGSNGSTTVTPSATQNPGNPGSNGSTTASSGNPQSTGNNNGNPGNTAATTPPTNPGGTTTTKPGNENKPGSTDTGSGNNNTSTGGTENTEKPEPAPEVHKHTWSEVYRTVHHDAEYETVTEDAWDEKVKIGRHSFCKGCNLDLTETYGTADCEAAGDHMSACGGGYYITTVYDTIHHDAVTYEECVKEAWDEDVLDHLECIKCGETAASWADAKSK